jgi:hypothetical protein
MDQYFTDPLKLRIKCSAHYSKQFPASSSASNGVLDNSIDTGVAGVMTGMAKVALMVAVY